MTLFMTSCGGKKSSRNCGSILATTRASLGKPFRILQTRNPGRANDDEKWDSCYNCMSKSSHHEIILETTNPWRSKMKKAANLRVKIFFVVLKSYNYINPCIMDGMCVHTCQRAQRPSPWQQWSTRCLGPEGQSGQGGWQGWLSPCLRRNQHDPPWRPPPLLRQSQSQPDL